ncbi:MAG TPA: hypothetical protein VFK05_14475 [Polyangiaceae bacterium]|nr:hypothetical protein [Polyangiaceae bacterium]
MSAANLLPDSALQAAPEVSDDACEPPLPTQPWHAPPDLLEALGPFEFDFELEHEQTLGDGAELEGGLEVGTEGFDFHDTIPAPPWLDEPAEALEMPVFPAR